MNDFLIIAIIFLLVMVVLYFIVTKIKTETKEKTKGQPPYRSKKLLTTHEMNFYKALKPVADEMNLTVLCQVSLLEILEIPKGTDNYMGWFNKIKAKHIDFLLCGADFSPALVIEIDDSSHDSTKRQERDKEIDSFFEAAKIPCIHFRNWKPEQVNEVVKSKLINIDK